MTPSVICREKIFSCCLAAGGEVASVVGAESVPTVGILEKNVGGGYFVRCLLVVWGGAEA